MTDSGGAVPGRVGSGAVVADAVVAGAVASARADRGVRAAGGSPPGARSGAAGWARAGWPASVRRGTGPVSPVCEPQSRPGCRGGDPSDGMSSSMTAHVCVAVASADASLTANAEYPGSSSASPAAPARPSHAVRMDARFHSENWPGGYTGSACLGAGGNPWIGPRDPLPVPRDGLTCAGAALRPPGTVPGMWESPGTREGPARRGSGLAGARVAPGARDRPEPSPGPVPEGRGDPGPSPGLVPGVREGPGLVPTARCAPGRCLALVPAACSTWPPLSREVVPGPRDAAPRPSLPGPGPGSRTGTGLSGTLVPARPCRGRPSWTP
jgi:hypothetical protein